MQRSTAAVPISRAAATLRLMHAPVECGHMKATGRYPDMRPQRQAGTSQHLHKYDGSARLNTVSHVYSTSGLSSSTPQAHGQPCRVDQILWNIVPSLTSSRRGTNVGSIPLAGLLSICFGRLPSLLRVCSGELITGPCTRPSSTGVSIALHVATCRGERCRRKGSRASGIGRVATVAARNNGPAEMT